jgi:uncharacterized membrane protein
MDLADVIAAFIGSWTFIIIQSILLTIWILLNVSGICHFDIYPFIFLNLFLSFEAAYATPLILMSANRQSDRDREHMIKDLKLDEEDHIIITDLKRILDELQKDVKIDRQLLQQHEMAKEERAELKALLQEVRSMINDRL